MENSILLVAAVFLILLALSLVGLFVHLVRATRSDCKNTINQLKSAILKIQQMENASERTFGEFKHLLEYRLRFLFVQTRKKTFVTSTQTDVEMGTPEVARQEAESQTDFVEKSDPTLSNVEPMEVTIEEKISPVPDQPASSQVDLSDLPVLPPIVTRPAESKIDLADLPTLESEPEAPCKEEVLPTQPRTSHADLSDLPPLVTRPAESKVDLSDLPPLPSKSQMSLDLSDLTHLVVQPAPSTDTVITIGDLD